MLISKKNNCKGINIKMKVLLIAGARPNFMKIAPVFPSRDANCLQVHQTKIG
ncbi:hypothetical protein BuS5_01252 [Desulfosarcina sp. BuS5]|uniref:hypothetical protein n=1 Tax=Desulfosarcina sp. BuS5 TaxID=933262 RepID=UPI000AE73536|nr:hypothetical protein [Desulfosarcina sp. BuS5]WDN88284.1 hypothetical protein BuS5_01252 [Desulfosarcina sp. BuS5]